MTYLIRMISVLSLFFGFGLAFASDQPDFRFRFVLLESGTQNRIALQAESGTEGTIARVCGATGADCACEFFDGAGNVLGHTTPAQITFDAAGNYFRCVYTGVLGTLAAARIYHGATTSTVLPVSTSLTLHDIVGGDLDLNHVRSIYRYSCEQNFLEKDGTTTQSFDCSNQAKLCDTGNFCLLQARFPYHLYADTYSTNFAQKVADRLYNGGGDGRICGLQIRQLNCADDAGFPTREFGIYAEQRGVWKTPVTLVSGPDYSAEIFGFAASVSVAGGECPPGLVKRSLFQVSVNTADINPGHNFTSGLISTEVRSPQQAPAPFHIVRYGKGNCDGTGCTMPVSFAGDAKTPQAYASAGSGSFCVIPDTLLQ